MEELHTIKREPGWPSYTDKYSYLDSKVELPYVNLVEVKVEADLQLKEENIAVGEECKFQVVKNEALYEECVVTETELHENLAISAPNFAEIHTNSSESEILRTDKTRNGQDLDLSSVDVKKLEVVDGYDEIPTESLICKEEASQSCKTCGEMFPEPSLLQNHVCSHTNRKVYSCEQCGKNYTRHGSLKKHILTHTTVKPFACPTCGRKYAYRSTLQDHILKHSGSTRYQCTVCDKTFYTRDAYIRHSNTHSGTKPHVCSVCEKPFADKSALNRHILTHSGRRPFECEKCGKSFNQRWYLTRHMNIHIWQKPDGFYY